MTEQQKKVLDFVREYIETHHRPPTLQNIADGIGYVVRDAPRKVLLQLRALGLVDWEPGMKASLRLIDSSPVGEAIPIYRLPAWRWYKDKVKA